MCFESRAPAYLGVLKLNQPILPVLLINICKKIHSCFLCGGGQSNSILFFTVLLEIYIFISMLWDPYRAFDMFVGVVKIRKQQKIAVCLYDDVILCLVFDPIFCHK